MVQTPPHRPVGRPPVWNVFQRRNIHFVGREQNLRDLEQIFTHAVPRRPQVLTGVGGSGKTALAIEYAYSRQELYDIIWWVRADTPATIAADLASLAPKLARTNQVFESTRQACNAAIEELRKRDRWLLIFDNAHQLKDLAPFLSAKSSGHVLITSSDSHWQSNVTVQPVHPWPREDTIEFLRRRLGGIDEAQAADRLAAALGDLPLAIDQAAACIGQADITLTQYLADYEQLWAELLGRGQPAGVYPTHIAMAWELSFRRIESLDPVAAQLLTLCGFFAPEEIPLEMIQNFPADLPLELATGLTDHATRNAALNLLERFSLGRTSDGVISIHGVIGAMAQDRLVPIRRQEWSTVALRIASGAFQFDSQNLNSWAACAQSLPHALSATLHAEAAGVVPNEVVDMLGRIGRFLLKQGNYSEARSLFEMGFNLVQSTFGPQSTQAADIANNLARVRHRLGDLAGASTLYDMALSIDRQNYGETDPRVATVANNSAMTLVELGQLQPARERFEWAIDLYRKSYTRDHPKIASVMNNLGFVLLQLKEPEPARQWLEQALTITESTFGSSHPQVACIAVNLGAAFRLQGKFDQARKLFDRAILIDQKAFGQNHPAIARDFLNLGQLLSDQKQFDEAVRHLERALAITESAYGPEHRETVLCLRELGRAVQGTGDIARAVECMMRAASLVRKPEKARSSETIVGDEGMLG